MNTPRFFLIVFVLSMLCHARGIIHTIAGNGSIFESGIGGQATSAGIGHPTGVAVDKAGNVYIADQLGQKVLEIVKSSGVVTLFAGSGSPLYSGDGGSAILAGIGFSATHSGMAFDSNGNLYLTDSFNNRIRMVNPQGVISTVAGSSNTAGSSGDGGKATAALLNTPEGVAVDSAGNIYIADTGNGRIRKVDTSGNISTIAGTVNGATLGDGGSALKAGFANPSDVVVDSKGTIYVADNGNGSIRVIANGTINTVAYGFLTGVCSPAPSPVANGYDGIAPGLAVDSSGNVYISDNIDACVQEYEVATQTIRAVAGGGAANPGDGGFATSAVLGNSVAVAVDSIGNLYIPEVNGYVREVTGLVAPASLPVISGVQNGASYEAGIAPNAWAQIQGTNLAPVTDFWNNYIVNGVLPTSLDGVSVTVNLSPAYISYISPTQINIVVPPSAGTGFLQVVVKTPAGSSASYMVLSAEYDPALFLWPGGQPVATHSDFTWAVKNGTFPGVTTVPAKPGETIILWGTGFGPSAPAVPPGIQVPVSAGGYPATSLPTISIDGENNVTATVYGAALAPGFAALWQIAFQVPPSLGSGDYLLFGSMGGTPFLAQPFTIQQ